MCLKMDETFDGFENINLDQLYNNFLNTDITLPIINIKRVSKDLPFREFRDGGGESCQSYEQSYIERNYMCTHTRGKHVRILVLIGLGNTWANAYTGCQSNA